MAEEFFNAVLDMNFALQKYNEEGGLLNLFSFKAALLFLCAYLNRIEFLFHVRLGAPE